MRKPKMGNVTSTNEEDVLHVTGLPLIAVKMYRQMMRLTIDKEQPTIVSHVNKALMIAWNTKVSSF